MFAQGAHVVHVHRAPAVMLSQLLQGRKQDIVTSFFLQIGASDPQPFPGHLVPARGTHTTRPSWPAGVYARLRLGSVSPACASYAYTMTLKQHACYTELLHSELIL